jgi:hypothetical protein
MVQHAMLLAHSRRRQDVGRLKIAIADRIDLQRFVRPIYAHAPPDLCLSQGLLFPNIVFRGDAAEVAR